jgi:hypothetical protein
MALTKIKVTFSTIKETNLIVKWGQHFEGNDL